MSKPFEAPYAMVGLSVLFIPKPSVYHAQRRETTKVATVVGSQANTLDLILVNQTHEPNYGSRICVRHLLDPWHIHNAAQSERNGAWVHIPCEDFERHFGIHFERNRIIDVLHERIREHAAKGTTPKMIASLLEKSGVTEDYVVNVLAESYIAPALIDPIVTPPPAKTPTAKT
jgi:hypothetical protein